MIPPALFFFLKIVFHSGFFFGSTQILIPFFFPSVSLRLHPTVYGSSQTRGQIKAVAHGLHHSHSTMGSEPHLQPIA